MELEVGAILQGKVTAITKFGAFVSFESGRSGLVHISEIANAYVSNISDFLKEGQEVSVKVIGIDEAGRINLSIKQALPPAPRPERNFQRPQGQQQNPRFSNSAERSQRSSYDRRPRTEQTAAPAASVLVQSQAEPAKPVDLSFEDKLKRFMQDSDSKISGLYAEKKSTRRRSR